MARYGCYRIGGLYFLYEETNSERRQSAYLIQKQPPKNQKNIYFSFQISLKQAVFVTLVLFEEWVSSGYCCLNGQ